jgi:2-iminobutanoate/2-iminopropanoate deaminase
MTIQALASGQLPRPRFQYSPAVKAGPWILFSGMIGLDVATGILEAGGAAAETQKILRNLSSALPEFGLTLAHLAQVRIYTTRFAEFGAINAVWESWLEGSARPPARTSVGVVALPLGASVEMEFAFFSEITT